MSCVCDRLLIQKIARLQMNVGLELRINFGPIPLQNRSAGMYQVNLNCGDSSGKALMDRVLEDDCRVTVFFFAVQIMLDGRRFVTAVTVHVDDVLGGFEDFSPVDKISRTD